ncbi:hypothetical protein HDE_13981 [Halotydeus destructor]|nr:hypothetical protein HDE_13981 [Halotydeus destructor]
MVLPMLGHTLSGQWRVFKWASQHRMHHKWSDRGGDPHNPARGLMVAAISSGSGYHDYHHTFPSDYTPSEALPAVQSGPSDHQPVGQGGPGLQLEDGQQGHDGQGQGPKGGQSPLRSQGFRESDRLPCLRH